MRETLLRGHDGRRYFIPNAKVMTDVIQVETDETMLRQSFSLLLDPTTDFALVRSVLVNALCGAEGVCSDPPAEFLLVDIVAGEVEVQCRFWSGSRRHEATSAREHAIAAVVAAVAEHGILLPVEELRVELTAEAGSANGRDDRPTRGAAEP